MPALVKYPRSYTAYAILEPGGKLQKITVPWKYPRPGEIVVKVLACGICATDEICANEVMPITYPRVPGHEIVGEVVAVSSQERLWRIGQRVGAGWHGGHCSVCQRCRGGHWLQCDHHMTTGATCDGGFAEYATIRSEAVVEVPEDIDPAEAAPMLCAGITAFQSLRNMVVSPPDLVAVQGIGGVGHLALQFSTAMGFRTVALSTDPSKELAARAFGAYEFIHTTAPGADPAASLRELGGAKVVVATAPDPHGAASLISSLNVNGTLLCLAAEREPMKISPLSLIVNKLSIRGWPAGTPKEVEEAFAFAQATGVQCIVERYPLYRAREAFELCKAARFRAVLVP